MNVYTPDGFFSTDDPLCLSGIVRGTAAQTYQDTIPFSYPENGPNFLTCAVCGLDDEKRRIVCVECPRSYHLTCFGDAAATDSSSVEEDEPIKTKCKRCEYDLIVRPDEDIPLGFDELSKPQAKKKIDKAYDRYKAEAQSYSYTSLILSKLMQILEKLISYEYGNIFAVPGECTIESLGLFLLLLLFCMSSGKIESVFLSSLRRSQY